MKKILSPLFALSLLLALASAARAQDSLRYIRLYLKDKGTPRRVLSPGDPLYAEAARLLTPRALERRAKVLPADALVTTDDLPIHPPYLAAIESLGAHVVQTSRWLNTVMVQADSTTLLLLEQLPFLDSIHVAHTRRKAADPFTKPTGTLPGIFTSPTIPLPPCITELYGSAEKQNDLIRIDAAHRMGIAGEGVLVGVLDAGFHWRDHEALKYLNVIAERDFVNHDSNAADEPGEESAEEHGTAVMSMIGATFDGVLVGGAPHASFIVAKTEDVRSERNVEEDNFVAGLEWVESMGADVTNTSLGYTDFDSPERGHSYEELNGHTAFASRGLNHAVGLGLICVVAAGNEAQKSYHYIGVPAEADSSIAVAAVTDRGAIAGFSSRGFGPSGVAGPAGRSLKPDIAAMGVGNWGANHSSASGLITGQGTSYASPMATGAIALILSARPSLRPWEVRSLLYRTADHATVPDTAFGHGVINVDRMLDELSRTAPVVGAPKGRMVGLQDFITIASGVRYLGGFPEGYVTGNDPTLYLDLRVRRIGSDGSETYSMPQPLYGTAHWMVPVSVEGTRIKYGDSIEVAIFFRGDGSLIRKDTIRLFANERPRFPSYHRMGSTLCDEPLDAPTYTAGRAVPNPFTIFTQIQFETNVRGLVSLIVYNALGEEMARVIDEEEMDPGTHTAFFQPAGLPSGAYYYAIKIGDEMRGGSLIYLH